MKCIGLLALTASLVATAAHAGEPAKGKVCDYDPRAFGRPAGPGPNDCGDQYNADWSLGGNTYNSAGKAKVLDVGGPSSILPYCRAGREMHVLVELPDGGRNQWVFPRFLNCP